MQINEFRSASGLAKAISIMLGILAALSLISQGFSAFQFYTYGIIPSANSREAVSVLSILSSILGFVVGLLSLAVIVVFLIWQNRAAKNTLALNTNSLSISPGWAVGWWFIPFASLVMPFLSINEINNGSKPENAIDPAYGGDTS
jgi:heme/copper-type cytochrome/quinol oxidase subunit 2